MYGKSAYSTVQNVSLFQLVLQFVTDSVHAFFFFLSSLWFVLLLTDTIIRHTQYFSFRSYSEFNIFMLQDKLNEGIINAFVTVYSGSR